ncbi:MAG TPA: flagellin [Balneolales bacterium]|nr:flagellin [Balneolales bacterium]
MAFGDINRVNTNLQSLSAQYSLNKINQELANNQLQLSTGLRINKAADDAAGFSIASKIKGKLAGMNQASRNIGDAKSMLNIGESGLNSIMDALIQIKSKATEGASGTLGQTEMNYVEKQINALGKQINTIAQNTKYNGSSLLYNSTGGAGSTIDKTFQVGDGSSDTYSVSINDSTTASLFATSATGLSSAAVGSFAMNESGSGGTVVSQTDFQNLLTDVGSAIDTLAGTTNQMGIDQNNLSIRQDNLSQAITSNSAAKSRIMDANFAQVKSDSVRLQILQQTATAALTQANSSPQSVLTILRG